MNRKPGTKRLMALCLCLMLLLSLIPSAALAAEDEAEAVIDAQEQVVEEPAVEEPTAGEPAIEEPTAGEPESEGPTGEEPAEEESSDEEPEAEEPAAEEPGDEESDAEEPVPEEASEEPVLDGASTVSYIDENGGTQVRTDCTVLTGSDSAEYALNAGWYAVTGDVTYRCIGTHGTVNLILCDGATLTATGGFIVTEGNTLNIYGQSGGTGRLNATGGTNNAGIGGYAQEVYAHRSLTEVVFVGYNYLTCGTIHIYGGMITAQGGNEGAGIGGCGYGLPGSVTVSGGTVDATGGYGAAGIGGGVSRMGGTIRITGGSVHAAGGYCGAGIGGGCYNAGGNLTISGGSVTATGGRGGAGIGGGYQGGCGSVTVTGGDVHAAGGYAGAGIGGGYKGNGGSVEVTGGSVEITGGGYAAGIGGGYQGGGGSVTVAGGNVHAVGGYAGAGIGGGYKGNGGSVEVTGGSVEITGGGYATAIGGGYANASPGMLSVVETLGLSAGSDAESAAPQLLSERIDSAHTYQFVRIGTCPHPGGRPVDRATHACDYCAATLEHVYDGVMYCAACGYVPYLDENGGAGAPHACTPLKEAGATLSDGWYVVNEDLNIPSSLDVDGDVHLILCDGVTLTVGKGVLVGEGKALSIYGQSEGTGRLDAAGDSFAAGIGGYTFSTGGHEPCGTVTINGGTVTARGGYSAAGIGGTQNSSGGTVTVNGGTVTAQGGERAAGIGGGEYGTDAVVVINGGTVTATGGKEGAGIGGGEEGKGIRVTVTGGSVEATGGFNGAGIGGGVCGYNSLNVKYGENDGAVTISGGSVNAVGGIGAAAIGGGYKQNGGTVAISGGNITAEGGDSGAGIGGGCIGHGGSVTVSGGEVSASGLNGGAGVGGGYNGDGADVSITGGSVTAYCYDLEAFPYDFPARAIGCGGDSRTGGALTIADGLVLYGGESADPSTVIPKENGDYARYMYMTVKPAPAPVPEFRTHSLVLSGEIGVNFFLYLPEGIDYTDSEMVFILGGGVVRDVFDPDDRDLNGHGYYGFTCYMSSVEMAEPITAIFHYGNGQSIRQTYSVKDYITAYEAVAGSYDADTTALVHALADYGHYAQPVLAEANGWTVGVDYAAMDVYYSDSLDYDAAASALSGYALKYDMGESNVGLINITLNLLSQTELRVLLTMENGYRGSVIATIDGESAVARRQADGRYLVSLRNIPAHQLGDSHEFVITTDDGTATVTASALSYAAATIGPNQSANARNAAAALWLYYKAAADFQAAHP